MKPLKYQSVFILTVIFTLASLSLEVRAARILSNTANSHLLAQENTNSRSPETSANDLFRKVYNNRYTWNNDFPGYTAVVEFKQGKNNYKGYVRVEPDLNVEVTGINDKDAIQAVKNQLLMLTIHRRNTPFEVTHKNKTFGFAPNAETKNGIVEIIEKGGKTPARYQLANNQIIQVQRQLGSYNVVVKTLDTDITPEGYISTQYQSTFYDAKTNQLVGEEISTDTYKKVDNYYLPIGKTIEHNENGNRFKSEFNFTEVKLMQANNR